MLFSFDPCWLEKSPICFIAFLKINLRLSIGRKMSIVIEIKITRSTGGSRWPNYRLSPSRGSITHTLTRKRVKKL